MLSIPTYYLIIYPILKLVLNKIYKVVRIFFWSKSGNWKGIRGVAWNNLTDTLTEGSLVIRNLLLAKQYSLMAKNMFKFLNDDDVFWVDILHILNMACLWFFRGPCTSAATLKPFCWISSLNLNCTSLLFWLVVFRGSFGL